MGQHNDHVAMRPPLLGRTVVALFRPATDHPLIDFRLVPFHRDAHPALDGRLQLGIVTFKMESVEAVDDVAHQIAHLIFVDMRDVRLGDVSTVRICDKDIGAPRKIALTAPLG